MTTTDTDALTERIARVLHKIDPITGHGHDWGKLSNSERKFYRHKAAAVLPIVAVEVRKASEKAWDDGEASGLTEAAGGHGWPNPYRETGDTDDHR